MTTRLAAFIAGTALVAFAQPLSAAEIQIASAGPIIELNVSDTVNAKPDMAVVNAGVTTRATSANEAARQNAERMDTIIARLRQLGVAQNDIQTSNFTLYPQYSYNNNGQQPTFLGYDVNNQVTVKLRDLSKIGPTLDALVAAGANNFSGPIFVLENDAGAKQEARKKAFASADARARELASYAGYTGVKLLELSESYQNFGGGVPPSPPPMPVAMNVSSADARATPIQPGMVGTAAQLTVKYEMVR